MKHLIFLLLTLSTSFALTEDEIMALNKKPHDQTELIEELQIFPTSRRISSEIIVTTPDIPDQKDTIITKSKDIEGKYIIRETTIAKEDLTLKFFTVIP